MTRARWATSVEPLIPASGIGPPRTFSTKSRTLRIQAFSGSPGKGGVERPRHQIESQLGIASAGPLQRGLELPTWRRLKPIYLNGRPAFSDEITQLLESEEPGADEFGATNTPDCLDAATARVSGHRLLPILAAERRPGLEVLGCDNRQEVVTCAPDLAEVTKQGSVRIELGDVLDASFDEVGRFGTVTAIHLLEHLSDDEIRTACGNMLHAGRRLVVAVPYEDTVQHVYGHEQLFDREKLATCGEWCARRIGGRYWCEDVSGGLLVVDRPPD